MKLFTLRIGFAVRAVFYYNHQQENGYTGQLHVWRMDMKIGNYGRQWVASFAMAASVLMLPGASSASDNPELDNALKGMREFGEAVKKDRVVFDGETQRQCNPDGNVKIGRLSRLGLKGGQPDATAVIITSTDQAITVRLQTMPEVTDKKGQKALEAQYISKVLEIAEDCAKRGGKNFGKRPVGFNYGAVGTLSPGSGISP